MAAERQGAAGGGGRGHHPAPGRGTAAAVVPGPQPDAATGNTDPGGQESGPGSRGGGSRSVPGGGAANRGRLREDTMAMKGACQSQDPAPPDWIRILPLGEVEA